MTIQQLMARAERRNGCLVLPRRRKRYAEVWMNGQKLYAHRAMWQAIHGPIPPGMEVCHRCDNGYCIAREHLFLGTHADNMADRNAKGRQRGASKHITAEQAQEIVSLHRYGFTIGVIALLFRRCPETISRQLRRASVNHQPLTP